MKINSIFMVVLFCVVMLFSKDCGARSITFPFTEEFDQAGNYNDLVRITQGATHTWESGGGWRGGCAKFTLPTINQGYSSLGQFGFSPTARLNIRFLYYTGSTYTNTDSGLGPKWLIFNRNTSNDSDRIIAQQHAFLDERWDWSLGNNTAAEYPNPVTWDYSAHENEWVCYEIECDLTTGYCKAWITCKASSATCSSWNETLYQTLTINNTEGDWVIIDFIGAYGGPSSGADEESYFKIDELKISNTYIGPPPGFRSGSGSDFRSGSGSDNDSGGCFIATAAFGSLMETNVKILRDFRDEILLRNSLGRDAVFFYYKYSPPIAAFISKHEELKMLVRWCLIPVVGLSWLALKLGPLAFSGLMVLLFILSGRIVSSCFRRRCRGAQPLG